MYLNNSKLNSNNVYRLIQDRTCPPGLHFSPYDNNCVDPKLAECSIDKEICTAGGTVGTPWDPILVANSRDCQAYFLCLGTTSVSMRCAPGLQFNKDESWCDVAEMVKCIVCSILSQIWKVHELTNDYIFAELITRTTRFARTNYLGLSKRYTWIIIRSTSRVL